MSISNISSSDGAFWTDPPNLDVPANSSANITIHFNPSLPILYSGKLTIHSNDPNSEFVNISVTGQGLAPTSRYLYASSQSVDFGAVPNDSVVTTRINLLNAGSGQINIANISLYSDYFQVENTPGSLEPGQTYPLDISFHPNYSGYLSGQITIDNNSVNQPQMVITLSGIGYDEYFTPVQPTGLPYKIIIQSIDTTTDYQPKTGDEFGIFDGRLCVGDIVIDTTKQIQTGTAWEANVDANMPGFKNGNQIKVHYAKHIGNSISAYWVDYNIIEGDGNFGTLPFSSLSLHITDTPVIPDAPVGLATQDSLQRVFFSWTENSENDIDLYRIYRNTTDNFNIDKETLIDSTDKNTTSFIDSTVENNVTYYYRISAVDGEGWESPPSISLRVKAIVIKVWNVHFQQRKDGSGLVDIYYSFSGQDTTHYEIIPEITSDGNNWTVINQIIGDIGQLTPGIDYKMVWNLITEIPSVYMSNAACKISVIYNKDAQSTPIGQSNTIYLDERE